MASSYENIVAGLSILDQKLVTLRDQVGLLQTENKRLAGELSKVTGKDVEVIDLEPVTVKSTTETSKIGNLGLVALAALLLSQGS